MHKQNNSYTKEDLYKKLELVNFWISNIDNKISFILGFVGIFIGFIISKSTPNIFIDISNMPVKDIVTLNFGQVFSIILVITMYSTVIYCLILLIIALKGKIDSKVYREHRLKTNSLLFFGNIANMNYCDYKEKCQKEGNKEFLDDISSQIYVNSKICNYKFKLYNCSIKLLIISLVVYCICELFNII